MKIAPIIFFSILCGCATSQPGRVAYSIRQFDDLLISTSPAYFGRVQVESEGSKKYYAIPFYLKNIGQEPLMLKTSEASCALPEASITPRCSFGGKEIAQIKRTEISAADVTLPAGEVALARCWIEADPQTHPVFSQKDFDGHLKLPFLSGGQKRTAQFEIRFRAKDFE